MMELNKVQDKINCTFEYPQLPPEECLKDEITDEIIVFIIIRMLVIYTFYKLYDVWNNKLNFSEVFCYVKDLRQKSILQSSLQGPQGWDLVISLLLKKLKSARKAKMFSSQCEEDPEQTCSVTTELQKRKESHRLKILATRSKYFPALPK